MRRVASTGVPRMTEIRYWWHFLAEDRGPLFRKNAPMPAPGGENLEKADHDLEHDQERDEELEQDGDAVRHGRSPAAVWSRGAQDRSVTMKGVPRALTVQADGQTLGEVSISSKLGEHPWSRCDCR
jgi:hypothetical protein